VISVKKVFEGLDYPLSFKPGLARDLIIPCAWEVRYAVMPGKFPKSKTKTGHTLMLNTLGFGLFYLCLRYFFRTINLLV
jgi:hypothetical protein